MPNPVYAPDLDALLYTECGGTLEFGRDPQDPQNPGLAFWYKPGDHRDGESGSIEDQEDIDALVGAYAAIVEEAA